MKNAFSFLSSLLSTFSNRLSIPKEFLFLILGLAVSNPVSGKELDKTVRTSVLHLHNGDYVTGRLVHSPAEETLGWQSPVFASPFHFPMSGVASIHFSTTPNLPQPEGIYSFELAGGSTGGDLVYGSLVGLDADVATLDVPGIGRMTVSRSIIQRISRRNGNSEQLFVGPSGLHGWQVIGEANTWSEDSGHLTSKTPGAVLSRDFKLPNLARFEFELSWTSQPDFKFAFGVGDDAKTAAKAFSFEVWDNEIVLQRETEREADVGLLQSVAGKSGRLHVQAFLDQMSGRMLVYSSSGKPMADLTVTTKTPEVFGGLQLTLKRGDIRLERLQIGRWNGETPKSVELDKSRIHVSDGTITYGAMKSFDADKHEFVVGDDAQTQRFAEEKVLDVFLSQGTEAAPRSLRAVYLTGMKISGDLVRVEDQKLWLKSPGIQEQIEVPLDSLQSLVVLKDKSDPPELPQRRGRLEIGGATLHGCLMDGTDGEATCLNWQPARSTAAGCINKGVSARIVYRDAPPPPVQPNPQQMQQPGLAVPQRVVRATVRKNSKTVGFVLHLRTGDKIPCESASLDEQGLTIKSSATDSTFVPHEQIKVLELLPDAPQMDFPGKKKERFLTLPRMQRDNPPLHVIRAVDGDYLRGRIISMDDDQIQMELRLEPKIIKRERVARIIWLHPESLAPATEKGADRPNTNILQALQPDGNRMTFVPEQVAETTLSGKSELLGACRVDLKNVDELLMGAAIEQATAQMAFHDWKLKQAANPLAPKEDSSGSGEGEGQESPLVGKQAPDIALATLDGKQFHLGEHKNKVVVLDFWASWCGPCLQAMPQIDKVVEEFRDQGVELFAVNLEESPEKIKAALTRLKLSPAVLLDRDGRIAEKYSATAIPQTVIIDREGKIVRLFVGGGARFDEQLREALKAVLGDGGAKSD